MAVDGASMAPTLQPGDWLLVDPEAYSDEPPVPGDLVLLADPRSPERLLVKRLQGLDGAGDLIVSGDAPDASTDSRDFGAVAADAVSGRPWLRYWPPRRISRIG